MARTGEVAEMSLNEYPPGYRVPPDDRPDLRQLQPGLAEGGLGDSNMHSSGEHVVDHEAEIRIALARQ
jgi:hypothetical protein